MKKAISPELLWQKFIYGEHRNHSFKELFDFYYAPLCRYANFYLKDKMDSEEVVLDFFLHLWKNKEWINIESSVDSYFYRSIRNRALNILRNRHKTESIEHILDIPDDIVNDIELDDIYEIIQRAVSSLPPRCKDVFLKSRNENLSNAEISHDMGISVKTVENQITKALKIIRISLKKNYILFL